MGEIPTHCPFNGPPANKNDKMPNIFMEEEHCCVYNFDNKPLNDQPNTAFLKVCDVWKVCSIDPFKMHPRGFLTGLLL